MPWSSAFGNGRRGEETAGRGTGLWRLHRQPVRDVSLWTAGAVHGGAWRRVGRYPGKYHRTMAAFKDAYDINGTLEGLRVVALRLKDVSLLRDVVKATAPWTAPACAASMATPNGRWVAASDKQATMHLLGWVPLG